MIALDTNILIYAIDPTDQRKFRLAQEIVFAAQDAASIVPMQVLGEYLAVAARKFPTHHEVALAAAESILASCTTPPTTAEDLLHASRLATRHQLQYFDALILTVAARAGTTILYSEDMQHGMKVGELTVSNPFLQS